MAEIETAIAGPLTDPSTWVGGALPTTEDVARIMHPGCTVPAGSHFECGGIIESLNNNATKILVDGDLTAYGEVRNNRGTLLRISSASTVTIHGLLRCTSGGGSYGGFPVVNMGTLTVTGETYGSNNANHGAVLENLGGISHLLGGVAVQANRGANLGIRVDGGEVNCPNGSGLRGSYHNYGGRVVVFDVVSGTLNLGGPLRIGSNCNFVSATGDAVINVTGVSPERGDDRTSVALSVSHKATLNIADQTIDVPPDVVFQVTAAEAQWQTGNVVLLSVDLSGLKIRNRGTCWIHCDPLATVTTDAETSVTDLRDGVSIVTGVPGLAVKRTRGRSSISSPYSMGYSE